MQDEEDHGEIEDLNRAEELLALGYPTIDVYILARMLYNKRIMENGNE